MKLSSRFLRNIGKGWRGFGSMDNVYTLNFERENYLLNIHNVCV